MNSLAEPVTEAKQSAFESWMREVQRSVDLALDAKLPSADIQPRRLHRAMRYAVLGGGKRVRPLLAYAAGELTGAPVPRIERVAVAVELIHAYSLVHDDLPCMDDDVLRRGRPTCHVQFDEATAMLAGDALQSEASLVIVDGPLADDPVRNIELLRLFALACGSRGMAGGQAIDLAGTGQALSLDELERMHRLKTGALIRAAILLAAGCGEPLAAADEAALSRFADAIGLAFQVVDDILDVEASSSQLGKTAGKDARQNKPTYVSILGIDAAKDKAAHLWEEARDALAGLGPRAQRLAALADFVILRKH
ncbi:MAG: polyprenyl synthetase family protein [Betaproteobacteria bacterium]